MTWTLLLMMCFGAKCAVMPMPSPGHGYDSERACLIAGQRIAATRGAYAYACRPRMDPSGEMGA